MFFIYLNIEYIFNFDTSNLSRTDYLFIITHYNDKSNIINSNFREEIFNKNTLRQNTLRDIKTNFFNNNIDDKLDEINNKFNREYNLILDLQKKFVEVINHMNSIKKAKKKVVVKKPPNKNSSSTFSVKKVLVSEYSYIL